MRHDATDRRRRWVCGLLLALGAAAACATGRFMELTGEEQSRFNRCRDVLANSRCAGQANQTQCMDRLAASYAELSSQQERSRFLIRGGCAPSVARGEATTPAALPPGSSSGGGAE